MVHVNIDPGLRTIDTHTHTQNRFKSTGYTIARSANVLTISLAHADAQLDATEPSINEASRIEIRRE